MRKFFILFFIPCYFFAQEIIEIKQNTITPFDGVLISHNEYTKIVQILSIYEKTQFLEKNLLLQISQYEHILMLKDEEIVYLTAKYEMEKKLRADFQKQIEQNELKIKILTITTSVGLSISFAELLGISAFAILIATAQTK